MLPLLTSVPSRNQWGSTNIIWREGSGCNSSCLSWALFLIKGRLALQKRSHFLSIYFCPLLIRSFLRLFFFSGISCIWNKIPNLHLRINIIIRLTVVKVTITWFKITVQGCLCYIDILFFMIMKVKLVILLSVGRKPAKKEKYGAQYRTFAGWLPPSMGWVIWGSEFLTEIIAAWQRRHEGCSCFIG